VPQKGHTNVPRQKVPKLSSLKGKSVSPQFAHIKAKTAWDEIVKVGDRRRTQLRFEGVVLGGVEGKATVVPHNTAHKRVNNTEVPPPVFPVNCASFLIYVRSELGSAAVRRIKRDIA
jgi:hypothetical protein